ncbi:MAG: hypothetical protein ABFD63_11990, partial [Smithella sp.]
GLVLILSALRISGFCWLFVIYRMNDSLFYSLSLDPCSLLLVPCTFSLDPYFFLAAASLA